MHIVLASYFEEENHGHGRKIGISPGKPRGLNYDCDLVFENLSPGDLYWEYHRQKKEDYDLAAKTFIESYKKQLDKFLEDLTEEAKKQGVEPMDLLPFEDGDTLLSWEKKGNVSYRSMVAEYLSEIGYDVEEN